MVGQGKGSKHLCPVRESQCSISQPHYSKQQLCGPRASLSVKVNDETSILLSVFYPVQMQKNWGLYKITDFFFIISCDLFLKLSSLTLGGKAERNCLSASLKVSIQKMTRIDIEQNDTNFHKTPMSFMNVNVYRNEPLMLRSQTGLQSLLSQCFNYVHGKQKMK